MHEETQRIQMLEGQVRALRRMGLAGTLVVAALAVTAFARPAPDRFTEIEVERINVVEADGRHALVLANSSRLPGIIVEGEEYPAELSQGRERSAGIIYFNHEGTEAGGLIYGSETAEDGLSAAGGFTVDRMNQDQVASVRYMEGPGSTLAGLMVWDRPEEHIQNELDAYMALVAGEITEEEWLDRVGTQRENTAMRVFTGSHNRMALVQLNDTRDRPRILMTVDSLDVPSLRFFDSEGNVTHQIPEP